MTYQEMIDFGYNTYNEYFKRNKERLEGENKMDWLLEYSKGLIKIINEKEGLEKMIKRIPDNESKYLKDFQKVVNEYFETAKREKENLLESPLTVVVSMIHRYFEGIMKFVEQEKEIRKYGEPIDLSSKEISENPAELY